MARHRCTSPAPLAALAVLLLICVSFHCAAAAARPLPSAAPPVIHSESGVKDAADGMVLQQGAAGNGAELSVSEMTGGAEEAEACEDGNDECMQRRLLGDAHLDYIYTQHKGKP